MELVGKPCEVLPKLSRRLVLQLLGASCLGVMGVGSSVQGQQTLPQVKNLRESLISAEIGYLRVSKEIFQVGELTSGIITLLNPNYMEEKGQIVYLILRGQDVEGLVQVSIILPPRTYSTFGFQAGPTAKTGGPMIFAVYTKTDSRVIPILFL